ncbi:MAG: hypothetical protein K0Q79_575 [Flavipsychrobacter sp.]|jgi:alkylhydroperoxidase/carboxymuconolactone decarboxylase family protein YurZ|nr:hypothetical protein [Flavipsychrobacter sp.]
MKKLILIVLLSAAGVNTYAQLHITTSVREDYLWNEEKNDWTFDTQNKNEATFFDFNKDMTMFKHTTPSMTSSYLIKSEVTTDKDRKKYEFDVMSDVGNKYHAIIDVTNNNIRFIGTSSDGGSFMVRHQIKRIWYDD